MDAAALLRLDEAQFVRMYRMLLRGYPIVEGDVVVHRPACSKAVEAPQPQPSPTHGAASLDEVLLFYFGRHGVDVGALKRLFVASVKEEVLRLSHDDVELARRHFDKAHPS